MSTASQFDFFQAHQIFSTHCFNRAWELIEKPLRSPEEADQMLLLALTSLWHWTQRDDCTRRNLSVGHWLVSRVYAVLGQPADAARYAEMCLRYSQEEPPFYLGYAHEACARAAMLGFDRERCAYHLKEARRLVLQIGDSEERAMLQRDVETIG